MSAAPRQALTVLVTSFNEADNIVACLRSVAWADDILLVDSHSTDATLERARGLVTRVLSHPYESPARQKNWGLAQALHPWVLILDADERVTPELEEEIRELLAAAPRQDAFWIRRRNTFLGRTIRFGGWGSDRVIRLCRPDRARYPEVLVHEEMVVDGEIGELRGALLHHSVRSLGQYGEKMERFSSLWAEDRYRRGRRASALTVALHTLGRFLRMYVLQGGFLEGGHGLIVALQGSYSVFLKYAKLWERSRPRPRPE